MRFSFSDWIKNLRYLKRFDIKTFQKTRAIVNTFSFFAVWFYLGYFISKKAEEKQIETGIPHSIQVARISGDKTILKWDLGTGTKQLIDVDQYLAEKEYEERQKILEKRRLREEELSQRINKSATDQ